MSGSDLAPDVYDALLTEVKRAVVGSRARAARRVANELVEMYWTIGKAIVDRQASEGWGAKVVDRLARDLRRAFPEMTGLSRTNLQYARAFVTAWPDRAIVQQPVGQLPWSQVITLLDKLDNRAEREWYAAAAVQRSWSRNLLLNAIKAGEQRRVGGAPSSFAAVLPAPDAAAAQQITKDPYLLDFLGLGETYTERQLEDALLARITATLQEFGPDLAYLGRQVHVDVGGEDFYIDLLFFHVQQLRFVVVELKVGTFEPEFLGKLGFYVAAIDAQRRDPTRHLPTVGILLVADRNETVVRYSLAGSSHPLAVSTYETLPDSERAAVPSDRELEQAFTQQVVVGDRQLTLAEGVALLDELEHAADTEDDSSTR